jgi:hypothetical protein
MIQEKKAFCNVGTKRFSIISYYGTGGDLNVDEIHEVIPKNVVYPLRGVLTTSNLQRLKINRIGQLQGVVK